MKVKGFLQDVLGASRVTNARRNLIKNASVLNVYSDPIREVAKEVHPEPFKVTVVSVSDASPTAKTFRLKPLAGKLPPFEAGMYVSFQDLKIGNTVTTRPFSISSAPFEARSEDPFFEVTIRKGRDNGFVSNYFYNEVREGDEFTVEMPFGQFFYEPMRDAKNVVALAGGSGITPFVSMAKEINHGTLDMDLTILYGSVSSKDIILKDVLDQVQSERVKVVNVISGEEDYDGEKGFLRAELIQKYSKGDTSYFVCGPLPMYQFVRGELAKLEVPEKRIRMEVFGAPVDITKAEGYPECEAQTFKLTVVRGIHEDVIEASSRESLAVAMERAGIKNNTRCRSGACGYCRCKLLDGDVFVPTVGDGRRYADKMYGYVHACSTYPLSDCRIKIVIK
ncbi:MAG: iron-sulfur cluster-binding domain-containing protein [Solobacterium sp.]|nr:iron-sulfur cluster-binding domain-containing protein [Solobacterium sp.]